MIWAGSVSWTENHSLNRHCWCLVLIGKETQKFEGGGGKEGKQTNFKIWLEYAHPREDLTCRMLFPPTPVPVESLLRWSHGYLNMEICKWGHSGSWKKWKYLDLAPSKRVWWWVIISMLSVGSQRHNEVPCKLQVWEHIKLLTKNFHTGAVSRAFT